MTETNNYEENNTNGVQEHSSNYQSLVNLGLSAEVANALDKIFVDGMVRFDELDERALEALKELDEEGALAVLKQFVESNLHHVQNKSAFLCGVMKIHRQRTKAEKEGIVNGGEVKKLGPSDDKLQTLLERTKYSLDVTTGQRRYGGPPPKDIYDGPEPGAGCQVFIGRIPRMVFEDELIPLLEDAGTIWDFRLMMDPLTGQNRGFGFVTYTDKDSANESVKKLDNYEIQPKKFLGVCVSQSNCRLFVGSIPKNKKKEEIFEEFNELTVGLTKVIIYMQTEDKQKNRGFCFLEYSDHKAASQARRKLSSAKVKAFNNTISVDWADPIDEPSDEIMSKVKVLYVKSLAVKATEEVIMNAFKAYGDIERVKKIKDYAFVHFEERDNALKALEELNGLNLEGEEIDISLAKPVDKKKKERQLERKMLNNSYGMGNPFFPRGGFMNRRGRGNMGGYGGMMPPMGGYGGYNDDYFSGDYNMGYGGFGYDEQYYSMGPRGGYRNQGMRGNQRGGGMYGGQQGGYRGRGGNNKGRGRGRGGNGMMGGRGKSVAPSKRSASFSDESGSIKRQNLGASSSEWEAKPIAQQPLKKENLGSEWFQDDVAEQWG